MQVEWLTKEPPNLRRHQSLFAIRGPEAATELAMLGALASLCTDTLPVLPLLHRPEATASGAAIAVLPDVADDARQVAEQFRLNKEQEEALQSTGAWFCTSTDQVSHR